MGIIEIQLVFMWASYQSDSYSKYSVCSQYQIQSSPPPPPKKCELVLPDCQNENQMRFIQQKRDLSPSPIHCKSLCHCSLMETKSRILRLLLPRNITQCPHHYHQISDITWKIIEKKCSG